MILYIVVSTSDYQPYVELVTEYHDKAVKYADNYSKDWAVRLVNSEETESESEIFFAQKKDDDMNDTITVFLRGWEDEIT
jgi:hypothetical protein